ncbi:MAG: DUF4351 domain-containing protein [Magnetococcus sp. DMHC-1]|nr:DUF4351 domain-containing protein [Magnetococcales bacterium]
MPTSYDKPARDSFDTPWKDILETYFKDFLAFFLPIAHDDIDWERGYEFLDTELASITREAEIGDRRMDKLVKVWQRNGDEHWVLIHIEIQGDRVSKFENRMYTCQYRAYDLQQKPVVGLAILADEESGWRPSEYRRTLWGKSLIYEFFTVKLLDYLEHQADLEQSDNPFSVVTLAHLHAKKTRHRPEDRYQIKLSLVRSLYKRGFSRQQVIDIFRFIDWVLRLPEEIDKRFRHEIHDMEENQNMPYISSVERIGMEIGREKGRQEEAVNILLRLLQRRFGPLSKGIHDTVEAADLASLEQWSDKILDAGSIDEIFASGCSGSGVPASQ